MNGAHKAAPLARGARPHDARPQLERWWTLSDDLLCVVGPDHTFRVVNPAFERTLGWSEQELIGSDPLALIHEEDAETGREAQRGRRERGGIPATPLRFRHADGSYRWILWSGYVEDGHSYSIGKDITAQKEAELSLAQSDSHSKALIGALSDGLLVADGDGRICQVNEPLCEMTGYSAAELEGILPPYPFWPEEHRDRIGASFQRSLRGHAGHREHTFMRRNGERFPVSVDVSTLRGENGEPQPGFLCLIRDLSDSARRAQGLREAQRLASIGSFEENRDTGVLTLSEEMYRLFGVDPADFGQTFEDALALIPAEDGGALSEMRERTFRDGRPRELEHRYLRDGAVRWAETRVKRLGSPGHWHGVLGTMQDITDRKLAEHEIHLQAHLLDSVDVAVITTGLDALITHWNSAAERMYGWTRAEMVGRSLAEVATGPDAPTAAEMIDAVRESGQWEGQCEVRRKDGSTFPAYIRNAFFGGLDGEPAGIVGVSVDVTDRVEGERHLTAARDYQRAITDSMGEGLFSLDTDDRLIYLNHAGEKILGWTHEELEGRVMHDLVHPRRPDGSPFPRHECPLVATLRNGEVTRVDDDVFIRRDGTPVPVEYTSSPFETADGVRGSVVVFSDISQRKAEERKLRSEMRALSWVERIREALAEDRLEIHAQPIVEVGTGRTVQHELLLRMREPDGTIVAPAEFLPVAEEHGLIVDIDIWVAQQAVELAARGFAVEFNLSARSIGSPRLMEEFRRSLVRSGADPSLLVIELTETALLEQEQAAELFIQRVGALGCRLALDDFGTGYGGFTYLKRLPVNFLKIDMEFVYDLPTNPASRHVVEAVVSLARGFGQKTVAEGVEHEATLALLAELGVDYAQGYAIAMPMPAGEVLGGAGSTAA